MIRRATPSDLPEILRIEQAASSAAHWTADHYRSRFADQPTAACLLVAACPNAKPDSQLCGFLCARIVAGEWEVENVVVDPVFQRRGLGGQLIHELIRRWYGSGAAALLLEVRESNAAARELYERCGFVEVGCRAAYYRDPEESAILYVLKCSSARADGG
jgi:ribosomal-protein-alanine N-acetyltransferase